MEFLGVTDYDEHRMRCCCPFHLEDTPSFIYNPKEFNCHCFGACARSFDIVDAYMKGHNATFVEAAEKLFELAEMSYSFGDHKVKTKHSYRYPPQIECTDKSLVYAYLAKRKISPETADYLDIRQDDKGNMVFNYYDERDVLTTQKFRPARRVQHGENKNWCRKDADTTPLLYNMNRINPAQPLIIATGELDCAALIESGFQNAVSVPFGDGTLTWIEECFDWLEQFQEIIVCHDNDQPGFKFVKEVVPRLGSWRCKVANCPETVYSEAKGATVSIKDINEVLFWCGRQGVVDMIAGAVDSPVPSLVDLSDVEEKDLSAMPGIQIGIEELDKQLLRLFYGTFNILSGTPGSGKTSWLYSLVCNTLNQGLNTWVFSRELPDYMTKNWINFLFAGPRNVNQYTNENGAIYYRVSDRAKRAINEAYKGMCYLYRDDYPNDVELIQESMVDAARKYGAKLFIVDNLMTVNLHSDNEDKNEKQTEFANWLIQFSTRYNVCTILVCHPRKLQTGQEDLEMYDVAGTSNLVNLAHRGFGLKRIKPKEKEGKRNKFGDGWEVKPYPYDVKLTVLKDRLRGRANFEMGMYYDEKSRRFFSNPAEYDFQYSWDTNVYDDVLPYPIVDPTVEIYGELCE